MSRKDKKDWGLDTLLSVVGFVFELVRVVVTALRHRHGTIEHLRRLLNEPALVNQVFDLIVVPSATAEVSGGSSFTAVIVYVQPKFEELKRRFPAYVSPDYKDKRFYPIKRCKDVSRENREVAFEYVHMNRDASAAVVLAEIDRKGLRPALYEELLGFAEKYPDEQREFPIVALGSGALAPGGRRVAYLWRNDKGRSLELSWIGCDWSGSCRFLAVRKASKATEQPKVKPDKPAGSEGRRPLGEGEYLVYVDYAQLPSFIDLEKEFGKGNVSSIFDGRPFQRHALCQDMDETPGERVILLKCFGRATTREANIAEMDKLGYRPATLLEAYAFQKANPDLQRQFGIVALGSFAMSEGRQYVAMLDSVSDGRLLGRRRFGYKWGSDCRFLFVRK